MWKVNNKKIQKINKPIVLILEVIRIRLIHLINQISIPSKRSTSLQAHTQIKVAVRGITDPKYL